MKNKFIAGAVAAVMAVTMLGSVSFAAAADMNVIAPEADSGYAAQTTKTILAFATDNAAAVAPDIACGDVIVAVEQRSDVPKSIKIDHDKLTGKKFVVVRYGGSTPVNDTVIIPLVSEGDEDVNLTALTVDDNVTVDGTTYTNVATATFTYRNNTDATQTITKCGVVFTSSTENSSAATVATGATDAISVGVEVGGTFTYEAVVLAVPYKGAESNDTGEEVELSKLSATPFIEFGN